MANDDKLKKFSVFLENLSPEELGLIAVQFRVSTFAFRDLGTANRNVLLNRLVCTGPDSSGFKEIDISGVARTGINGQFEWKLSDFLCASQLGDGVSVLEIQDVNFLATPISDQARLLTTSRGSVSSDHRDAAITVFTWQPGGQAAGSISFSWRCRLIAQRQFLLG